MNPLYWAMLTALVRYGLVGVFTWLTAKGVWTEEQSNQYLAEVTIGVAGLLVTVAWGLWARFKSRQKLVTALASPKGTTENDVKHMVSANMAPSATTPADQVPRLKDSLS